MNLHCVRIRNFRRLKDILIDFDENISIFVGANNSGKTSATQALQLFLAANKARIAFHDFSVDSWAAFDAYGDFDFNAKGDEPHPVCPTMSMDLWFSVDASDLHRVMNFLPSLDWEGSLVGVRIELAPSDPAAMLDAYRQAKAKAALHIQPATDEREAYHPWPKSLSDYLERVLPQEFEFRYFVLDHSKFDADFRQADEGYIPARMTSDKGSAAATLAGLLKVSFLGAQRNLAEDSGGRAENLSKHLAGYYRRNLEKIEADYAALGALADSQSKLNVHLKKVFLDILEKLQKLGYPGLDNPKIEIRSSVDPTALLTSNEGTRVYYGLDLPGAEGAGLSLPDHCNGLGFKNLIYMVVQLLDFDSSWRREEQDRAPLHLVFIEEPEAHMHAQLQQVFIREILELLEVPDGDAGFKSQLVVTTHSSHILYERGFTPIRYFRRGNGDRRQLTDVVNLSRFYAEAPEPDRDFLARYLKLTHCDIFFADAAILVEGNVERLLLPLMIGKAAPRLNSCYLSVLEVGGAFGFKFKRLIEFLGITALLITDIDSVEPDVFDAEGKKISGGSGCKVDFEGAVTSNQTLRQWLPGKITIAELIAVTIDQRTQLPDENSQASIHVVYQTGTLTRWKKNGQENAEELELTGRTLEESFALQNLEWCQDGSRKDLGLRIPRAAERSLVELTDAIGKRVRGKSFGKTDFALALMHEKDAWEVPAYIHDGLRWLESKILPPVETTNTGGANEGELATTEEEA
jgi:predicted ATP-dependent endonuclease of OLD family